MLQNENKKGGDMMSYNKLAVFRRELNFSQQEVADMLSISRAAYSLKENGHRKFSQKEMGIIFAKFKERYPKLNMQDIFLT
jgi:prophage L54a, cro-related protein